MTTPASLVSQASWSATLPTWRVAAPLAAVRAVGSVAGHQARREAPAEFRRTYSEAEQEGLAERQRYLALRSGSGQNAPKQAAEGEAQPATPPWRWNAQLGPEVLASVYNELALPRETTGRSLDLFV